MGQSAPTYNPFAIFDGQIVAVEKATVPVMTKALQYGMGIFGGLRGYYSKTDKQLYVFRLNDHIKRFYQSLHILGVDLRHSPEEMKDLILQMMKKNAPTTDTYIRIFGYAGSIALSPNLAQDPVFDFTAYSTPLQEYLSLSEGISVKVSSWRRISDNAIPSRAKISGSYINSALAKKEAIADGYAEAIFLNEDGHVAEGSAMNIFLVRDGVLISPGYADDILEGITMRSIIQIARDMGIPTQQRTIDRSELYIADEAFFTGTAAQLAPIGTIDNRPIADGTPGPITRRLQEKFFAVVRGADPEYRDWCTPISHSAKKKS